LTVPVTFIEQNAPVDDYGRALYAVARSVLRALIDSITNEDLRDLNTPLKDVRMRQLAKVVRITRDTGMRGDGFEWAVHEAILGKEKTVVEPVLEAMRRASKHIKDRTPTSLMLTPSSTRQEQTLSFSQTREADHSRLAPGSLKPPAGPMLRAN
jgi:hypothetical protein